MQLPAQTCLIACTLLCLVAPGHGQFHKDPPKDGHVDFENAKWRIDPYTKHDQEALFEKAGYVSYAPFHWADSHHTRDIDKLLPAAMFLWVETKHFKIASSLPPSKLPRDPKKRKQIRDELKELKKILPKVNYRAKVLDRWLRLHLFAMRFERLYTDFSKLVGVTDADFPQKVLKAGTVKKGTKYMGLGPCLGMANKPHIMLCTKRSTLGHYSRFATGRAHSRENAHWFLYSNRSAFFGTNLEIGRGCLLDDGYLHLYMIFNVGAMLIDGFKDNTYVIPPWLRQGLSNWLVKQTDPEEEFFFGIQEFNLTDRDRDETDWPLVTRKLVKHGVGFKSAAVLLPLRVAGKMTLEDQMTAWSRCDFLIKHDQKKFARFMDLMKDQLPHEPNVLPTNEAINKNQELALKKAYGFDYAAFDEAWMAYVLKNYPRK